MVRQASNLCPCLLSIDAIFHFYKGCEIITKDNLIYILSEQPATAQVAEETCLSYGGRLAQISNQEEKQFLEPHLRSFYIPGCYARLLIIIFPGQICCLKSEKTMKLFSLNDAIVRSIMITECTRGCQLSQALGARFLAVFQQRTIS